MPVETSLSSWEVIRPGTVPENLVRGVTGGCPQAGGHSLRGKGGGEGGRQNPPLQQLDAVFPRQG